MARARALAPLLLLALSGVAAEDAMSFLAIGDWGGDSDSKPTSRGEDANNKAMGAVAEQLGNTQFVMALGDNFYTHGVDTCDSPRFQETFEDVFTHPKLQVPWYAVAGNHDHYGNVDAQIQYTGLSPTNRWKFPSLYYTFNASFTPAGGAPVTTQVVYIDTVTFSGMSYHDHETGEFVRGAGPPDAELAGSQLAWLEEQLAASTADYLWVAGHYPVYSQCSHGPTRELINDVLPLLKKYKATGYLAGHDHCLGHFVDETAQLAFALSGAGKECCYRASHARDVPAGLQKFGLDDGTKRQYGSPDGGFASFKVTVEATQITYHSSNGDVLYVAPPVASRKGRF